MGALGNLEQEDIMMCRRSHPHVMFLISIQLLRETKYWCWGCTCGICVVKVWAATLIKQLVGSLRGNQERFNPLRSIKLE
jgi:hypothetical protein